MEEERRLAKEQGYESPVYDSIEETHECYNANLKLVLSNMKSNDKILVASHNVDSCDLATDIIDER